MGNEIINKKMNKKDSVRDAMSLTILKIFINAK